MLTLCHKEQPFPSWWEGERQLPTEPLRGDYPEYIKLDCQVHLPYLGLFVCLQWLLWMPSCHLYGWAPAAMFVHLPSALVTDHWIKEETWATLLKWVPLLQLPLLHCWFQNLYLHDISLPTNSIFVQWSTEQRDLPDVPQIAYATSPNITYLFPVPLKSKHLGLPTLTPK